MSTWAWQPLLPGGTQLQADGTRPGRFSDTAFANEQFRSRSLKSAELTDTASATTSFGGASVVAGVLTDEATATTAFGGSAVSSGALSDTVTAETSFGGAYASGETEPETPPERPFSIWQDTLSLKPQAKGVLYAVEAPDGFEAVGELGFNLAELDNDLLLFAA